ncbi:MAG: ABC transporter ATP-binding protein [Acidobacteria bacterium]|nr:ABC transporter ATP-binding protein [Acidobacteriota bacterium]
MSSVVELHKVSKRYGSTLALDGVDLRVDDGQFVTLLGPSGCGKTTLLRSIAGFVELTSGEVVLDGRVINDVPANQRPVGMLFQQYALFPHMTVEENVSFGLRMQGRSKAVVAHKVDDLLALVEMGQFRSRYPSQLSGGQQQRVALARTLAIEPRVLLLDEPLAALDRKLRMQMRIDLKKLIDRIGITTICVTHDQDEALTMSDKVALMNGGVIVQYGDPLEIYDRPVSAFAAGFVGDATLLNGAVHRDRIGQLVFESEQGTTVVPANPSIVEGPACLLVRPEHLRVSTQPLEQHDLPGVVTFVTHLGAVTEYEVRLDDGPDVRIDTVRSGEVPTLEAGMRVYVGFRPGTSQWVFPTAAVASASPAPHDTPRRAEAR